MMSLLLVVVRRNIEKKRHVIFMRKATTIFYTPKGSPKAMSTGVDAGSLDREQGI